MAKRCKGLNSKCFLITYLIIVGFLLVLWMNRLPLMQEDMREIPADLAPYLASPPRPLNVSMITDSKLALTQDWFKDKWTFVYFSHVNCLPGCQPTLQTFSKLSKAFASNSVGFLVVGLDGQDQPLSALSDMLTKHDIVVPVATANADVLESIARQFIALFLRTDYSDGSYLIEQEHHVFLVDPKGRVYATFQPPYQASSITALFSKIRLFYAKTE